MNLAFVRTTSAAGTRSLRERLVRNVGRAAAVLLVAVALPGWIFPTRTLRDEADRRRVGAARQGAILIDRLQAERGRQLELIAMGPSVVHAARLGTEAAARAGLPDPRGLDKKAI